tara:strand:+ start:951 stop:1115 length:165 start_codon:yes stop_codon:yes gene_type:complete
MKTNTTLELGNNEQVSRGIFRNENGTWTAMTFTMSKTFKTHHGACRWFKKWSGQ